MNPAAPSPKYLLAAEKVGFRYPDGPVILDEVSLAAESGSLTMLVGRSGSGKTTLLRLLQGLLQPHHGKIVRTPAELVCAYIPQGLGLVRNSTALQNVLAGALHRTGFFRSVSARFGRSDIREAEALLERVGLAHKAGELAGRLSGGERQRVAIARCLMRKPHFVLADEFVSQLDAVTSLEMDALVRQSVAAGTGWVITTHHLDAACEAGGRVVALKNGRVVLDRHCNGTDAAALARVIA